MQFANKKNCKKSAKNYFLFRREKYGIQIAKKIIEGIKINYLCINTIYNSYKKEVIQMTAKAKIKVIKKKELKTTEKPVKAKKISKQVAAREMVSTVSNWVSDFQNRKREETKKAIENFFSNQPQASGV